MLLAILFLLLPTLTICFVLHLPASVLDVPVSRLSQERVRLALPAGTVQSGRGELWIRDVSGREWKPWLPVDWRLELRWAGIFPALDLVSNAGVLVLDRTGLTLTRAEFNVPPALVLSFVNHPLANAQWRGDIQVESRRFFCSWRGISQEVPGCDGQATLRWQSMGSSILPLQNFGSYAALVLAQPQDGGSWRADVTTDSGIVKLHGSAHIKQESFRYRIAISSENELIGGLNSIAGPSVRRQGNSGEFVLEN